MAVVGRTADTLNDVVQELGGLGSPAAAFIADVRDADIVESVVAAVDSELGPPSILVNNAGVSHTALGPIVTLNAVEFWDTMTVNVRGPFLWTQAVLGGMLARRSGRIINISSGAARAAIPNGAAYCTSKAALSHFTAVLAAETVDTGVVAFALAPLAATDGLQALTTATGLTDDQRRMFTHLYTTAPEKLLADSLHLFRTVLSGGIDHASGSHLDSTRPLAEQIPDS